MPLAPGMEGVLEHETFAVAEVLFREDFSDDLEELMWRCQAEVIDEGAKVVAVLCPARKRLHGRQMPW